MHKELGKGAGDALGSYGAQVDGLAPGLAFRHGAGFEIKVEAAAGIVDEAVEMGESGADVLQGCVGGLVAGDVELQGFQHGAAVGGLVVVEGAYLVAGLADLVDRSARGEDVVGRVRVAGLPEGLDRSAADA